MINFLNGENGGGDGKRLRGKIEQIELKKLEKLNIDELSQVNGGFFWKLAVDDLSQVGKLKKLIMMKRGKDIGDVELWIG